MKHNPNFALESGSFISRAIWPELLASARNSARTEDEKKVVGLVGSFVKEDTCPPEGIQKVPGPQEGGKGGFTWFSRGKK